MKGTPRQRYLAKQLLEALRSIEGQVVLNEHHPSSGSLIIMVPYEPKQKRVDRMLCVTSPEDPCFRYEHENKRWNIKYHGNRSLISQIEEEVLNVSPQDRIFVLGGDSVKADLENKIQKINVPPNVTIENIREYFPDARQVWPASDLIIGKA
jgi:hypothetical protein